MRRLTALPRISPGADADRAVCKPRPSVREGLCGRRKGAQEGHTIKAGKAPELGSHGPGNCRPRPGRGRGRVRQAGGAADTDIHTRRGSAAFTPGTHSSWVGVPGSGNRGSREGLGPREVLEHHDGRPARQGGASPPSPCLVPTKHRPQHPAPHQALQRPVGWPDGEVGTSTENCEQWLSEPEAALALGHPIFLSPSPNCLTHEQTFGDSGALARRRQPTSRTCKAVPAGQ